MKWLRRIIFILTAAAMLTVSAQAAGSQLAVMHRWEDMSLTGVSFALYPAEADDTEPQVVWRRILQEGTAPAVEAVTDANGVALFEDVEDGRYLLVGRSLALDGSVYEAEMSLLQLPGYDDKGQPLAQVVAETKISRRDAEQETPWRVIILWEDGEGSARPGSMPVTLYRNGALYETVALGHTDNWQYEWYDSDPAADWLAIGEVPEGYRTEYSREGNTFIIKNILLPVQHEPTDPTLPQTGQLWWPVPVMALAGMVLFLLGFLRRKEQQDEG